MTYALIMASILVLAGFIQPHQTLANDIAEDGRPSQRSPEQQKRSEPGSPRIINGNTTTISQWPWQAALAVPQGFGGYGGTRSRVFCGGVVIGSRLILTAAHCILKSTWYGYRITQPERIEVITGRTRLNSSDGQVTRVKQVTVPRDTASNTIRYPNWDVALLELTDPVSATPIKLAGPDESAAGQPGQTVWATGWGMRYWNDYRLSPVLRVARQTMFADSACRLTYRGFRSQTMNCFGGPKGNATTCDGDSGGSIATRVVGGYRLVGLTSFGVEYCWGYEPTGGTRVAADPIRSWIATSAVELTGDQVVGSGAGVFPVPSSCEVPHLLGLRWQTAQRTARRSGCKLGSILVLTPQARKMGRVGYQSNPRGWYGPKGLKVWVTLRMPNN